MRATLTLLPWLILTACNGDDPTDPGNGGNTDSTDTTDATDDTDVVVEDWDAVLINFDELGGNVDVSTEYADHVTFSATDDTKLFAWDYSRYARSTPFTAYTARSGGGAGVASDLTWTFTDPVRNLQFYSLGDQRDGVLATIDISYGAGQTASVDMMGDGSASQADLHDLSAYERITEITIRDMVDPSSVNYDDISFDQLRR